jgi:hypothetical protein
MPQTPFESLLPWHPFVTLALKERVIVPTFRTSSAQFAIFTSK